MAPSAVCASEMPSLALRAAMFRPRIWLVKRSEMARPAASSLALLMRRPDDRRWMEVLSEPWLTPRLRWAVSEATLVLIVEAMGILLRVDEWWLLVRTRHHGEPGGNDGAIFQAERPSRYSDKTGKSPAVLLFGAWTGGFFANHPKVFRM